MTEQEQRIAIAEFCGWENIRQVGTFTGPTVTVGDVPGLAQEITKELPDYTHSLDAIREAELKMSGDEWRIYLGFLTESRTIPRLMSMDEFHACWNSNAARRAKAMLRTIGKWKD